MFLFEWTPNHVASLGVLMTTALIAGGLGSFLRLPKVTSYLLCGVLVGPAVFEWVSKETLDVFEPLTELAIAFVLFNLGAHFPLPKLRRVFRRSLRFSFGEMALTFVFVTVGIWVAFIVVGESSTGETVPLLTRLLQPVSIAVLLGILALATAPATTILVLKEIESEGPLTEYSQAMVAVNNMVTIVLFELVFVGIHFFHGSLDVPVIQEIGSLARDILGSILVGIVGGLWIGFCYTLVGEGRRIVLLIATMIFILGICHGLHIPYLLTFLAMGGMLANSTYHSKQISAEMDRIAALLCVIFFVVHGAQLDLDAFASVGLVGVVYIFLRSLGKYLGVYFFARKYTDEPHIKNWLGVTLLAQAGVAITLAGIAAEKYPLIGGQIQSIILGTVVVFEIVGPLSIRAAMIRSGEVPLSHVIPHSKMELFDQIQNVWNSLMLALGRDPWKRLAPNELTVDQLMRKKVPAVQQTATFEEVVAFIEHSHDNIYAVVNQTNELTGIIRYRELGNVLFDPSVNALIRAADIAVPSTRVLFPDNTASDAFGMFSVTKDDCIPVVTREEPHLLLGILRRRDLMRQHLRSQG